MSDSEAEGRKRASAFLRTCMAEKELGPTELASLAGVDPGTVADFADGSRWPILKNRAKIEKALGLDVGTFDRLRVPEGSTPTATVSEPSPTVTVDEVGVGARAGRHLVTVRAEAIGVTLTVDYDGPEDRRRALAEAMWALGIERGNDGGGLSASEDGDHPA